MPCSSNPVIQDNEEVSPSSLQVKIGNQTWIVFRSFSMFFVVIRSYANIVLLGVMRFKTT